MLATGLNNYFIFRKTKMIKMLVPTILYVIIPDIVLDQRIIELVFYIKLITIDEKMNKLYIISSSNLNKNNFYDV